MPELDHPVAKPWYSDAAAIENPLLTTADPDIQRYIREIVFDGVAVIENSLSEEVCDQALSGFRQCENKNASIFHQHRDDHGHYPRLINMHLAIPALRDLFSENSLALRVQRHLFQADPAVYTSLFYERGSAQDIHRDTPYFTTRPENLFLGVWVALEDAGSANGALQVVRGGHRIPELDREALALKRYKSLDDVPTSDDNLWMDYQDSVKSSCTELRLRVEDVEVKKGTTVMWHPMLPHGGGPIGDLARTRFSLVMHTTPVGLAVHHMDAFFNPRRNFQSTKPWPYLHHKGADFVDHGVVGFGHGHDHKVSDLLM